MYSNPCYIISVPLHLAHGDGHYNCYLVYNCHVLEIGNSRYMSANLAANPSSNEFIPVSNYFLIGYFVLDCLDT